MKARAQRITLLTFVLSTLAGCGSASSDASSEGAVRTEHRRLITQPLFATSVENRIIDPEFTQVATGAKPAQFSFFSAASGTPAPAPVISRLVTPRGISTTVEIAGGTLTAAFIGGHGPFRASVWVADAGGGAGPDANVSIVKRGGTAPAFTLTAGESVVSNGRSWVAYRASVEEDIVTAGFIVVTARSAPVTVAAPEVLGGATNPSSPAARGRAPTPEEESSTQRAVAASTPDHG